MSKLLLTLGCGVALAVVMLQLRTQWLNLNLQNCRLHSDIESHQAQLWSQQLRIAESTAPTAIAQKVRDANIPLEPANHVSDKSWLYESQPQASATPTE